MTNDLKQHLKNNPQLETVFVNDKGEWQFHKRKGFTKELSRDEVLKMKVAADTATDTKKAEVTASAPSAEDLAKTMEDFKAQIKAELLKEIAEEAAADKIKIEAEDAEKAKTQSK